MDKLLHAIETRKCSGLVGHHWLVLYADLTVPLPFGSTCSCNKQMVS